MNNVLVIAPHPDDETLGCGGALLRHHSAGDKLSWVIATEATEANGFSKARTESREKEISEVGISYGFSSIHSLGHKPTELDILPLGTMIDQISRIFQEEQPEIVYLPFPGDAHSDHKAVFHASIACTKSFRYPFIRSIRLYETLSETDFGISPIENTFRPNLFIDISSFLDEKIRIMNLYKGEILPPPFPRSEQNLRALASLHGAKTNTHAAEAFMQIIEIMK